ncbi:7721_t:CDS:10 [Acaulospora colombiana]|uniref:7721_t:CDS:1 n=1 Tax=Acaulospora colombiana TaxID=27376 RepID=A0ACA9KEG5_9GLOM|nr:7721_t:CDS:10 [Acaulospora colombiana]
MPFSRKEIDDTQSECSNSNSASAQVKVAKKPATPITTQKTLLSYIQKGLPTPSPGESHREKYEEKFRAPVTPKTPSTNSNLDKTDGEVERESSDLTEEFEEPNFGRRTLRRRVKRRIYVSSDEEEDDAPTLKKPRKKQNNNDDGEFVYDAHMGEESDEDAMSGVVQNESNYEDEEHKSERSNRSNKQVSKASGSSTSAHNKLKAFASSATSRRGASFLPSIIMTDFEKKKQRAADFKAKNDERYQWLLDVKDADGNPEEERNYFHAFEYSLNLINRYKVARVDQMETAIGKEMREKSNKKKEDKVIRRELTSILTAGTIVDGGLLTNDMSTYCMSIKEVCQTDSSPPAFGICFVDTATAEFHLTSFVDDIDRTQFETLIMQVKPKEIVFEKGKLSPRSQRILKDCTHRAIWTGLRPDVEFWDANTTCDEIRFSRYFSKNLKKVFTRDEDDVMGNRDDDDDLVSLKNFYIYDPIRHSTSLILDGQTLANLEVFENSLDGSDQGTVFKLLNHCITPFGKRTFKRWLCHPLRNIDAINERLDAVEELNAAPAFRESFCTIFSHFPDLERLISRIHAKTCKVKEFLLVLTAFENLMKGVANLGGYTSQFRSRRLLKLFDSIPDLAPMLHYFRGAFKHEEAENEGHLIPHPGIEKDYDEIKNNLRAIDKQLADHLAEANRKLKTTKIVYKDVGKEIYQLEVPNTIKVPDDWRKLSRTQKVNRYWNPTLQKLVRDLQEAQEVESGILKSIQGRFYEKFDSHYHEWLRAVKSIAELDCLLSLAKSSSALGEPCCRPQFVQEGPSVLEFEELRHPCIVSGVANDFIPNDTFVGGNQPNIILLTGPNMGGKSTLLRQVWDTDFSKNFGRCLMTPFDRIYTRIGANDNILAGQSTFMVELSETSKILHEATPRSMVILDELGRGTSTFDGYAIAYSVLHYLATHIGCLGLFSTHYVMLTQEFSKNPNIALKHMSCQVDQDRKEVTFLYKLVPGVCPKSYGMNVANMAGIPRQIVDRAEVIAAKFEQTSRLQDTLTANKSGIPITTLCDFAYLLKAASKNVDLSEDVGDRALDNQSDREKAERHSRVLKAIIRGIMTIYR